MQACIDVWTTEGRVMRVVSVSIGREVYVVDRAGGGSNGWTRGLSCALPGREGQAHTQPPSLQTNPWARTPLELAHQRQGHSTLRIQECRHRSLVGLLERHRTAGGPNGCTVFQEARPWNRFDVQPTPGRHMYNHWSMQEGY